MGTGASKNLAVGVPLNPRVDYADSLAKKEGKPMLIDAPVLVKLQHGTVRYRYKENEAIEDTKGPKHCRIDKPHEGTVNTNKKGYFFHPTLNDFSEEAAYSKEEEWKFSYVSHGPRKARQKQLFYVFGKGLNNNINKGIIKDGTDVRPQGEGYQWPSVFKQHGHVYYDISFIKQDAELEELDDEDADMEVITDINDNQVKPTILSFQHGDRVKKLQKRMSVRLIKPGGHIHVYYHGKELSSTDVIGDVRSEEDGKWKRFRVTLRPK